ncbi:MAG: hypothetical protein LQ348_002910 [Seirophora lacunosa]|nr:MAG: hypothetical protein LQ348_002910 [Seirophora lacunosa]
MESLSTFQGRINKTAGEASEANVVAKTTQIEDTSIALAKRPKVEHTDRGQVSIGKKSSRKMLKATPKQRSDGNVMGTNNSSIVSKRSVERLYMDKPHFFHYFVKKPIRRSPLINRGYWLRMHAVETVVRNFLDKSSDRKKVVVNLGCGYDPSPFKWLSVERYRNAATFIDVDYPELMARKKEVIMQNQELERLVGPLHTDTPHPGLLLCSDSYMAVGCDLRDTTTLSSILDHKLELSNCLVLCVAEVSLTYMDVRAADALIKWAAGFNDVRFCLLEQCFPGGDEKHPFAQKMLQHFDNLNTPLRCVHTYPTPEDQQSRFLNAGFYSARARTLWDIWHDSCLMDPKLRSHLNSVEPFDEWEEFALFSLHYVLVEAVKIPHTSTMNDTQRSNIRSPGSEAQDDAVPPSNGMSTEVISSPNHRRQRKFGAITICSKTMIGMHGGIESKGRMQTTDRYRLHGAEADCERLPDPPLNIPARACHTITSVGGGRELLVGGRTSPDEAMRGCWLGGVDGWKTVHDLPKPLYRHCAAAVSVSDDGGDAVGVLICGGRSTGGAINGAWYLWQETKGWSELTVSNHSTCEPRFGATIAATRVRQGLLLGGMTEQGTLCDGVWEWFLENNGSPQIWLRRRQDIDIRPRMGACLVQSTAGLLLIGGVSRSLLSEGEEILCIRDLHDEAIDPGSFQKSNEGHSMAVAPLKLDFSNSRPLLVGHAAHATGSNLLVVGGGAVCFSFGAHWNHEIWTILLPDNGRSSSSSQRLVTDTNAQLDFRPENDGQAEDPKVPAVRPADTKDILRVKLETAEDFDRLMNLSRPFIMENLDIGSCTKAWTADELLKRVTVHQAQDDNMNFQRKNFQYVKKPFGEFVADCTSGSKQYMRSLSAEKPAAQPANFQNDFPELRDDFHLPEQLAVVSRNEHSSPFRISGPVNMWLHYDVMANVLSQIRGSKVVALYPPSDALHFRIPPASSTSPINVFADDTHGRGVITDPHPHIRATLDAGDVLYIPPMWLHTAAPLENLSISINVFFKSLKTGYAAGRDVYGNRDLQPYENGRRAIEKIVKSFDGLPKDIGGAYLERLAEELKAKAIALRENGGD